MTITIDEVALKKAAGFIWKELKKCAAPATITYCLCRLACQLACVDVVNQLTDAEVIKMPKGEYIDGIGFDINSPSIEEYEEEEEEECCDKHKIGF